MFKIDQRNIRIFHIKNDGDDEELRRFLDKNLPILQHYLLVFDSLSDDLKKYLDSIKVDYIKPHSLDIASQKVTNIQCDISADSTPHQDTKKVQDSPKNEIKNYTTKVLNKIIRSGESIQNDGDIVVFQRVNSAAIIRSDKNVCIFGKCDGDVECNGEFMILSSISKGKIVFNGEYITPNMLKYKLNLIIKENGLLNIKDILSLL